VFGRAERVRRFPYLQPLVRDTAGAEIVEFAVSLPLLVVVLVGIFDFGSAFNVKHKLDNAASKVHAWLRISLRTIFPPGERRPVPLQSQFALSEILSTLP